MDPLIINAWHVPGWRGVTSTRESLRWHPSNADRLWPINHAFQFIIVDQYAIILYMVSLLRHHLLRSTTDVINPLILNAWHMSGCRGVTSWLQAHASPTDDIPQTVLWNDLIPSQSTEHPAGTSSGCRRGLGNDGPALPSRLWICRSMTRRRMAEPEWDPCRTLHELIRTITPSG